VTLEARGARFLRFKDKEILGNPETVSQVIETWIKEK
jgi:very-short-patch-repair endonuclease